jgi:Ca2+/Na+ antiporter
VNKLILLLAFVLCGCVATPELPDVPYDYFESLDLTPDQNAKIGALESACFTMMTVFAALGALFLVVSTFIGGIGRNAGFVMIVLAAGAGCAPFVIVDLVTNIWFKIFVYLLVTSAIIYAVWQGFHTHKQYKDALPLPDKPIE